MLTCSKFFFHLVLNQYLCCNNGMKPGDILSFKAETDFFSKLTAILFILSLAIAPVAYSDTFHSAMVMDISDREYEPAVIDLLDNAQESIVISMYVIKPNTKGPVSLLVNDLVEALDRGVSVDIYQNTKATYGNTEEEDRELLKEQLLDKGANIYEVDTTYRLHDKVIVVDSRYVVEGSHNWSVSALKSNFESSSLIDSPELAKVKLERIRNLPIEGDMPERPDVIRKVREVGAVPVKSALIEDKQYFPYLMKYRSDRSMMIYFILLRESMNWEYVKKEDKRVEFPISLEYLAKEIGIPDDWTNATKRRPVIKTLKKLDSKHGLIGVDFSYGDDAWIVIKDIPGGTFPVKSAFFDPEQLRSLSTSAKYVSLIESFLASEGKTMDDYTKRAISKRFHIGVEALRRGIKELG